MPRTNLNSLLATFAATALLTAAGCGGDDDNGDEDAARPASTSQATATTRDEKPKSTPAERPKTTEKKSESKASRPERKAPAGAQARRLRRALKAQQQRPFTPARAQCAQLRIQARSKLISKKSADELCARIRRISSRSPRDPTAMQRQAEEIVKVIAEANKRASSRAPGR